MSDHGIDNFTWLQHSWINRLQSLFLLLVMAIFFAILGWLLWGGDGVLVVLLIGLASVLMNTMISPRLVMYLYGAQAISPRHLPILWQILAQLTKAAELPSIPELYYVPSQMLNAFAVGARNNSAIAITDGLMRQLTVRELAGVMAHEISHIRNNDLWIMGLADMFSRMTNTMSWIGQLLLFINLPLLIISEASINWFAIFLLIFAPNLSAIAQLALSRTREYNADLNAAHLTGDPDGLASGLLKIEQLQGNWLERIFFPGRRVPVPSMLRTHPETRERIKRLMQIKLQRPRSAAWSDTNSIVHAYDYKQPVSRSPRWHISGLWH